MNIFAKKLKSWMHTQYGFMVPEPHLEYKLSKLLDRLHLDQQQYWQALSDREETVVQATLDTFTIQESYFFRDTLLFDYLKTTLLPGLMMQKQLEHDKAIKIWSAGCARGEEIYSIAICLDQLMHQASHFNVKLIGTDICHSALNKARSGCFSSASIRGLTKTMVSSYFEWHEKHYLLKDSIRDKVQFVYDNLASDQQKYKNCDLIVCRNVFIYLDRVVINAILDKFYDCLNPNGILLLGPADFVTYHPNRFVVDVEHDLQVLRKSPKSSSVVIKQPTHKQVSVIKKIKTPDKQDVMLKIRAYLDKRQFQPALMLIKTECHTRAGHALLYRYAAEAFIGVGQLIESEAHLAKAIQYDPLDAVSYFLRAMLSMDKNNHTAAITDLQKALYLDPRFPEAAYYLGLIYLQHQERKQALRYLHQALNSAKTRHKDSTLLCFAASFEEFIQAIKELILHTTKDGHHESP